MQNLICIICRARAEGRGHGRVQGKRHLPNNILAVYHWPACSAWMCLMWKLMAELPSLWLLALIMQIHFTKLWLRIHKISCSVLNLVTYLQILIKSSFTLQGCSYVLWKETAEVDWKLQFDYFLKISSAICYWTSKIRKDINL